MKRVLSNIIKTPFVKNVAIMATGAAGAQAVTMALSPIITRLYGPEAFGIMGTFSALANIIIPIAALTYPIAIVLPKSNIEAKSIIKLSLYITAIFSIITTVILLFFNEAIVNIFNIGEISSYLYLIPLVIIFAGLVQVAEQWLIRTNQFAINAKVNFLQSIIINGSKVGVGFIYPVATVLVTLQVAANGLRAFLMICLAKRSNNYSGLIKTNLQNLSITKLAKKYIDFPLYRAPEVFFSSFSTNLPILLLTSFFGPAAAGFYSVGRTVLALPSRLIGQSIGDVFYPRISEAANNNENLSNLLKKATLALIIIGMVPFGMVFFMGPALFEFVFGSGWGIAGEYARWIALLSFSIFINKPSVRSLPVLKAQRFHLFFTITMLIMQSLALFIGFFIYDSDVIAVALFGSVGMLLNFILIIITIKMSSNYNSKPQGKKYKTM